MKVFWSVAAAGLLFAGCSRSNGPSPGCSELPLRHEAIEERDASMEAAVAGVEIEAPKDFAIYREWGPAREGSALRLIQGLADLVSPKDDELLTELESRRIDWAVESVVIDRSFSRGRERHFVLRATTLEIHEGHESACLDSDQEPTGLAGMAVGGKEAWTAYIVPKAVEDVRVVPHVARYRIPRHAAAGGCVRGATDLSLISHHWHAALATGGRYRMWISESRGCFGPGCAKVFVSESTDGVYWKPKQVVADRQAVFDAPTSLDLGWNSTAVAPSETDGLLMVHARGLHVSRSDDGLHWVTEATELDESLSGGLQSLSIQSLTVLRHEGRYWLWFEPLSGDAPRIHLMTSEDGRSWTRVGDGPVLVEGEVGSFDEWGVASPQVIRLDGQFVMVYVGQYGGEPGRPLRSVLATAISDDGVHWTKSERPLLGPRSEQVGDVFHSPSVVADSDGLRVWFADRMNTIYHARCPW